MVNFYISNALGQNFSKFRDSYSEIIVAQAQKFWISMKKGFIGRP